MEINKRLAVVILVSTFCIVLLLPTPGAALNTHSSVSPFAQTPTPTNTLRVILLSPTETEPPTLTSTSTPTMTPVIVTITPAPSYLVYLPEVNR